MFVFLQEPITDVCDLRLKRTGIYSLTFAHALCNFNDGESLRCKVAPLGPWKYPDFFQVGLTYFNLIPFGVLRKLFPQGEVTDEEQRAPLGVLTGVFEVRIGHDVLEHLLILTEYGAVEFAFQKFCDGFIFSDFSDE